MAIIAPLPDENPGDEFVALVVAVDQEKPKTSDIVALRRYLIEHPDYAQHLGNLANMVEVNLVEKSLKASAGVTQSIKVYCAQMRDELGYEAASQTERLLIEAVILSWLRYHYCELTFVGAQESGLSNAQFESFEKRLTLCQRRYLRSIESLARVRRLLKEPKNNMAFNLLLKQQLGG